MRVLFVCLGNICRSPTAEGVLRHQLQAAGLADRVHVASAGTGDWHVGKAPDSRSLQGCAGTRLRPVGAACPAGQGGAFCASTTWSWPWTESNLRDLQRPAPAHRNGRTRTCSCAAMARCSMRCLTLTMAAPTASSRCSTWSRRRARRWCWKSRGGYEPGSGRSRYR